MWAMFKTGASLGLLSSLFIQFLIDDCRGKAATMKAVEDSWFNCPWQVWVAVLIVTYVVHGALAFRQLTRPTVSATVTIKGPATAQALNAAMGRAAEVVDTTMVDVK